jgi:hypothetical protein
MFSSFWFLFSAQIHSVIVHIDRIKKKRNKKILKNSDNMFNYSLSDADKTRPNLVVSSVDSLHCEEMKNYIRDCQQPKTENERNKKRKEPNPRTTF